jgi:hypothetical protein
VTLPSGLVVVVVSFVPVTVTLPSALVMVLVPSAFTTV